MLKLHDFYREFDKIPKDYRFEMIRYEAEPTSLFVIFQQLTQVRAQQRHFAQREAHLLALAELGLRQIDEKKDGDPKKP